MEDSKSKKKKKKQKLTQPLTLELGALIDALQVLCVSLIAGAHEKTVGKERATPTQLIKTAKARHLVGVTIFRCSTWPYQSFPTVK